MPRPPLLIVILAAGMGVRMRSARPKALHAIAGRSLLGHVLAQAEAAAAAGIAVVVAPGMAEVRAEALARAPSAQLFEQMTQAGTGDAVLAARPALEGHRGDVIVLFADSPLIEPATLEQLRAALDAGAAVAVLGFEAEDPTGYGRLILDASGSVAAIREHQDCSASERDNRLSNAGAMAFRVPALAELIGRIGNHNASREYYLTDVVDLANRDGHKVLPVVCSAEEAIGINTRAQLAAAEAVFQRRARSKALEHGVTMIAPETVWFSYDTVIGRDVSIEPNVVFAPGVVVEDGAQILANSHFTGARIGKGARVGPFARLRPGADVGANVHIGNFVEVKNATFEPGAKANHLAYIGDGRVGAKANIGAGTIFCNYDGFHKHLTEIGKGAFIGSNTSLVAPVKVGEGAYIASGSVITRNVAEDALAVARSRQEERPGWAAKFRALIKNRKPQR